MFGKLAKLPGKHGELLNSMSPTNPINAVNSKNSTNPLTEDLDHILTHTHDLWEELRDQRIFITGGTGILGCWLLESFAWANEELHLNAEALVLTRNYEAFSNKAPHLATNPAIKFHIGDIRTFEFPTGKFSHIVHAAAETNVKLDNPTPLLMFETNMEGTRHALDFARSCGAHKFLLISSGAVYGKQPSELKHIPEDYRGAPDITDLNTAYGQAKRTAEFLCLAYAEQFGLAVKLARCFAFVGPYLPLDSGFAIGNFIRDALQGKLIQVKGDGTPYRSYLYAADLAIWLWTILFNGQSGRPYNVGSEKDLTIQELSNIVAEAFPCVDVQIAKKVVPGKPPERYVPSTRRAQTELGLRILIQLPEAIKRTVRWHMASM